MQGPELERIGGTVERYVRIQDTGGRCTEDGCDADAPYVLLSDRVRVSLPCPAHSPDDVPPSDELAAELAVGALAASGLSERMAAFTFESYAAALAGEQSCMDALAFVQDWRDDYVAGVRRNMLMWGEVGCGKSGLAAALVRDLCSRGIRARYVDFAALLDAIRDCIAHKQPTSRALSVGDRPVVVLDDLGSEKTTEWSSAELLSIVNERYENGLPTIYISNYGPKALAEKLGKFDDVVGTRIVSRIREGASMMEHHGRNLRLGRAA